MHRDHNVCEAIDPHWGALAKKLITEIAAKVVAIHLEQMVYDSLIPLPHLTNFIFHVILVQHGLTHVYLLFVHNCSQVCCGVIISSLSSWCPSCI
jgi:hypothetical protein